jgi:phage terminase large subunit-like protein
MTDAATRYADDVVEGRIVAGQFVRLACQRHLLDLERGHERGLVWEPERVQRVADLYAQFRHVKGEWAGQPIILQPPQLFMYGSLFGWRLADGRRRFRESFHSVGRKNAKTSGVAPLLPVLISLDGEAGAEGYVAATKRDQARITYRIARQMCMQSPDWRRRLRIMQHEVRDEQSGSVFTALGSDADTTDGLNPHVAVVDEFHAHGTADLYNVLVSGMGARRQPLLLVTTTAGKHRSGPCWEMRQRCIATMQSSVAGESYNDALFAFIAEIDDGDDWRDESVWPKANPLLGVSVYPEYLRAQRDVALIDLAAQMEFRQKNCNEWLEQFSEWLPASKWVECATQYREDDLLGRRCYGGLDLSKTADLTAFTLLFEPAREGDPWLLWFYAWMPLERLRALEREQHELMRAWADQGYLLTTPGDVVDYDAIEEFVANCARRFKLQEVGYDAYFAAQLVQRLQDRHNVNMVEYRQGPRTMGPLMQEFERMVRTKQIAHNGNPLATHCVANVVPKIDSGGGLMPDKARRRGRIDPIVAALMAVGGKLRRPEKKVLNVEPILFGGI